MSSSSEQKSDQTEGRQRGFEPLRKSLRLGAALAVLLAASVSAQPGGPGEGGGWQGKPRGGFGGGGPGDGPFGGHGGAPGIERISPRLLHDLNLTPEQEKKFRDGKLAMQKRNIQLHSEKALLELDLKAVLSAYPVNPSEAMKIGEKVADVERKLSLLRVEAWSQFLSGLTQEQHRKVMEMQEELQEKRRAWRENFSPGGTGRGPGPGPGMGPRGN